MVGSGVAKADNHLTSPSMPKTDLRENFPPLASASRNYSGALPEDVRAVGSEQSSIQKSKNKKIGIVDDEASLCSAYKMVLKNLGFEAEFVAHDGAEAVRFVLDGDAKPDLIIMDYRMPVMDGLEAATQIQRERPGVIIVIASADDSVEPTVIACHLHYLHKPFSIAELKNLLRGLLRT